MNSSFSVEEDGSSSIFDDDFGEEYDELEGADATGSVSSSSSVVLALPDDGVSVDESEGERTTDQYVPFVVGSVPLYLAAGDDGKPIYIRQVPQGSQTTTNTSGQDLSFGGFSDNSGSTFEGFGSGMFEGFMEDTCDSDESQFDGFSEDSAEIVEGKQKIEYIRKWQKMSQSYNNLDLDSFLEDSNRPKGFSEAQPGTSKGGRKKPKVAQSSSRPTGYVSPGKRKRLSSPDKQNPERLGKASVGNDTSSGSATAEGKRKHRRVSSPKEKPKNVKPQNVKSSGPSKNEKTELFYLVPDSDVKDEIEIKEEEEQANNNEFIGVHCNQIGCTISWLESMSTKFVTVTNGIVFELDEFAKRINWERVDLVKWILRLRGILNIEPSEEDLDKIHVVLKRRKALTVTLAGNKRGHLKLQEFDTSEFTLPSDIKKEIEEVIIPEAIVVNLDDVEVNKRSLPLNVGNAGQSSDAHDHLVVPANVGPVHYINENVYEEGEIRKSGRAQKPSARIRDRDGNLTSHDFIQSSVVLTMRGVSDSCRRSLPIGSEMRRASEDAKKFSKVKGNLKKRRVSEDSRLMSAKASTVSKSSENRTGVGDVELEEGEVPNNDLQSLNKTRDSRVSYYCRENRVYPYFNETNECLGKYCTAAGLTVGDLNSLGGKDIHITQGLVTELHRFYRDRGCTITALAQRLLQFKELNSVNLVSMIVKISNLIKVKKGKKDPNSLNAEFIIPRSKKDDGSSKEKFQAPGWEIKVKQGIPTQASEVRKSRCSSGDKIGNSDVGTDVVVNSQKPEKKMTDKSTLRADADKGEGILNDRSQGKPMRRSSRLSFEVYPDEAVLASNDRSKINEKRARGSVITSDDQRSNKSSEYREEEFDNDKPLKETDLKAVEGKSENEKPPRKLSLQRLKRKPGSQKSNSKSFEKGPKGEERPEEKSVTKIGESSIDGEMETVDKQGPEEQFQREMDGVFESRQAKKKPKLQKRKEVNVSSADSFKGKETSDNQSQKGDTDVIEESKTDKEVEKDEDHLPPGLLKDREVGHKSAKEGGEGKPKMHKSDSKLNDKNEDDADMESDNDNESVGGGSDVGGGVDVGLSCESDDEGCEIGSGNRDAKDGKDSAQLDSQTEGTSTAFDVLLGKGKSVENKVECTTPKHIGKKSEDYDKDGSKNLGNEEECVKAKPDVENKSDADTKPEKEKCSIPEDTSSGKDDEEAMKKDNSISKKDSNGNDEMENEKKLCHGNDKDVTLIAGQEKRESIGINDTGTAKQNDVPAGNLNIKTEDGIERGQVSSPKDKSAEIRRGERERTLSKRVQEFHSVSDFFDDYTPEPKLPPKTPKVVDSPGDIRGKPVPKKRSGNGLAKQFLARTDPRVSFSFIDGRIIPYFKEKDFYLGSYCESVGMTVDILNSREPKDIFLTRGVIVELVHFYKSRGCTMTSLADRLLRMKKIYLASILNLVARFGPNLKYEGKHKKMIEEFVFPPGEMNVVKRTPNRKNPKTKNKEVAGLPTMKSNKKGKSKKPPPSSTYTCEVVFTDGTTKSKKKKKKKEHGTDVIGVKKLSDMKKGNPKSSGAGVGKVPDQFIVDKEVENARGKEGSVTRADIVLLYAKWLKNKNKIGSSVFVTDLLQDVVKLMEERKVQTIRIPAGTLMSSSVKLYEEYRRMWNTSKADAMMYLEEDWLEDIQYLVSITQTSRRSTVEGNEGDGNAPNADEINTGPRPLHDEGNFSDVSSERSLRIDESYVSDGSDLSDFVDSKISDVKRKKGNLSKIKPAPKRKKKSEADNKKLNTKSPSSVNTKGSPAVSKERGFEIEKIVDYKCKLDNNMKRQVSYLVRWKGCGPAKDMWMSEEELQCPKTLNKYWSGSTSSQKSHGVLKWQPLAHNPKMDFSEMLNSLETVKDLPGDISDHAVSECLSGDEVNDKENSPHNLSSLKPKVDKGYMTNGELLHLYDCWRQENQKLLSSKKSHSLNIKAFTEKVRKAMLTHGIETVYSDFLLQACFILTLIRKMLSSEEALREFLCKDCMPALESSRTNQENNRKNRGSAKIKVLSTNFCKLKAEVKKARDTTAGNRLRIAVAEDEIENMERSWDRAQGKSGFLNGALRQEINKLGTNLSKLREEEHIHLAKEFQHENPEKYEKTCSDILECGVPKNNIDTVMNSVLKVIGRFTDDVQEGKDK